MLLTQSFQNGFLDKRIAAHIVVADRDQPELMRLADLALSLIHIYPPQFTESVLRDIMESIPISVNASEIITFLMNGQAAFVQACGNKY